MFLLFLLCVSCLKSEFFLKLNPKGEVPVLTCEGGSNVYVDSEEILTRIAEGAVSGGEQLLQAPQDMVDDWRTTTNAKIKVVGKEAVLRGGESVEDLKNLLRGVDGNIVGPYLCGSSMSLADCSAFPFLWRIDDEFGPLTEKDGCGNIRRWLDKCSEDEAFKKTIQSSWWWWW